MSNDSQLKPAVSRLDGVDVLRGISILSVVVTHIWIRFLFDDVRMGLSWTSALAHLVWFNGGNGVTIFFAVSGFLITLTSLRRFGSLAAMRPKTFYRIRFARIMPLLVLLLVVLSAFHLFHVNGFVIDAKHFTLPRALLAALTFHLNWLETARDAYLPACWTVLWSLSLEEAFYLFFPLACMVLLRWKHGSWLWIGLALAFVAMGPFARTVWSTTDLAKENSYLAGMASIALGCLTAWVTDLLSRRNVRRGGWLLAIQTLGWATILLIAIWPAWHHLLRRLNKTGTDDTLLALGTCLVMLPTALRGTEGHWWSAPVRWFGRHSYEIYLSHEFLVIVGVNVIFEHWFRHGTSRAALAALVIGIMAMTAPLGWALAKFFAEPMNRRLRGAAPAK
jgi:peptidoglycan/LPS O-acetylase OafA/YrhL